MTYQPSGAVYSKTSAAFFTWNAKVSQAIGQNFDLSLLNHTWSTAPVVSGDTILLPKGYYFAQAFVSAEKTTASENVRFTFSLDGVNIGKYGQTDMYLNYQTDTADCEFVVSDGTSALSLELLAIETAVPTITANSRIVLWRVDYIEAL